MSKKPRKRFDNRAEILQSIDDAETDLKLAKELVNEHDARKEKLKLELSKLSCMGIDALSQSDRDVFHAKSREINRPQRGGRSPAQEDSAIAGNAFKAKRRAGTV